MFDNADEQGSLNKTFYKGSNTNEHFLLHIWRHKRIHMPMDFKQAAFHDYLC
jgi:hypothetical protein